MAMLLWAAASYLLVACEVVAASSSYYDDHNPRRPVVGVLTEPNSARTEHYIAASYVKWLEAAGARSVAIPYNAKDRVLEDIFRQVNGILLPGGTDNSLPRTVKKIWELAKKANDDGDFFPVWATCLGFEYVIEVVGDEGEATLQHGFDAWNISMPLNFTDQVHKSRAFANGEIRDILSTLPVTMNNHHDGIEPGKFANDFSLSSTFIVTATNVDRRGRPFVSAIEARDYPFYGVQFHPEKNSFEFATYRGTDIPYEAINHSPEAVRICLHLAQFFVSEVRKNTHVYEDVEKYPLVWTYEMVLGLGFEQKFVVDRVSRERPLLPSNSNGVDVESNATKWAHAMVAVAALGVFFAGSGFAFRKWGKTPSSEEEKEFLMA